MIRPTLLVLAAGMGSRYGGLKQIDPVGPSGEALLDYSVYDAMQARFGKIVFVIRRDIEQSFRDTIGRNYEKLLPVEYAYQELDMLPTGFTLPPSRQKPWGTGHAIWVAHHLIDEPFVAINADDFYGRAAYQTMRHYLAQPDSAAYGMVGYPLRHTLSDYGTVARGICQGDAHGFLQSVTEITNIERVGDAARYVNEAGQTIPLSGETIVSMNFWGFQPAIFAELEQLFRQFLSQQGDNPNAEFYIPWAINELMHVKQIPVALLTCDSPWFGMTYQADKSHVRDSIATLVEQGVYPANLFTVS